MHARPLYRALEAPVEVPRNPEPDQLDPLLASERLHQRLHGRSDRSIRELGVGVPRPTGPPLPSGESIGSDRKSSGTRSPHSQRCERHSRIGKWNVKGVSLKRRSRVPSNAVGSEDPAAAMPTQFELMWPTVEALRRSGGSATISEITDDVVRTEGFTEEQQAIKRRPGDHMSMIEYRLAWARNGLKLAGFIENSSRGVWALTDAGRTVASADALLAEVKRWRAEYNRRYLERKRAQAVPPTEAGEDEFDDQLDEASDPDWQDALLDRLLQMSPAAFERLAQRVLREAGFRDVQVLGRSNDGGIDGVGTLRVSLISVPIYFQCKRYRDSVGSGAVRDFRGAMAGRGEKGLLITTGTFTREAQNEANRDGAPPIELVSGQDLAELLRSYELGVRTELREVMTVEPAFFDQFE